MYNRGDVTMTIEQELARADMVCMWISLTAIGGILIVIGALLVQTIREWLKGRKDKKS